MTDQAVRQRSSAGDIRQRSSAGDIRPDHEVPIVFRLEETRRQLLLIVAAALAGMGVLLTGLLVVALPDLVGDPIGLVLIAAPAIGSAGLALLVVRALDRIRLVVDPEGVEYHALGAALRASWEDVEGLGPAVHGPLSGEGLRLRRVVVVRAPIVLQMTDLVPDGRAIPLAPFALPLRGSSLETALRHRAPWLVREESRPVVFDLPGPDPATDRLLVTRHPAATLPPRALDLLGDRPPLAPIPLT